MLDGQLVDGQSEDALGHNTVTARGDGNEFLLLITRKPMAVLYAMMTLLNFYSVLFYCANRLYESNC